MANYTAYIPALGSTTYDVQISNFIVASEAIDTEVETARNGEANLLDSINLKLSLAGGAMSGTITNFTSTGIDDNSTATTLTLDASNNAIFGDNNRIYLGTDSDMYLYHSGTNSYISNTVGNMYIRNSGVTSDLFLDNLTVSQYTYLRTQDSGNTQKNNIILGGPTPYIRLYHDDTEKLRTTLNGITVGNAPSTETVAIEVGLGRSGNGTSHIDLISDVTHTDYGLRIVRNNTGANATSQILHKGTGNLELITESASDLVFYTTNTQRGYFDSLGGLVIGSPTGGPKGVGSINASTMFVNNNAVWHVGNDGVGSGLNADLLDGNEGIYYAPLASPTFTGTPSLPTGTTATTQTIDDNSTKLATTAYADTAATEAAAVKVPLNYISGLNLSNNTTDANKDIDIAAGECGLSDTTFAELSATMVKQLDATWAVGTNAGGMAVITTETGTFTTSGTAVTGSSSSFNTEFAVNDVLYSDDKVEGRRITVVTNSTTMTIESAFTTDVSVADTVKKNGLAPNTWYHTHLIKKVSNGVIDAYFDLSTSAAGIPSGYTAYRRIGSIRTDGSSNIYAFVQDGDTIIWLDNKTITNSIVTSSTYVENMYKPLGINCLAHIQGYATCGATGGGSLYYRSDLESTLYLIGPTRDNYDYGCSVFYSLQQDGLYYYFSSSASISGAINSIGYTDFRGKN